MILTYPIKKIHKNLAITDEREVLAFYSIPFFSSSPIDVKKKATTKESIATALRKLMPNADFELSLVSKDFLLFEKMSDMSKILVKEHLNVGIEMLNEWTERWTDEMEIPTKYEWLLGIKLTRDLDELNFKEFFQKKIDEQMNIVLSAFGRKIKIEDDWYKSWLDIEHSLRYALIALKPIPLTEDQLYYHQKLQFLPYISHQYEDVMRMRETENITDTVIEVLDNGTLVFKSNFGKSYVKLLPLGKSNGILNDNHIMELIQNFNFPINFKMKNHFLPWSGTFGLHGTLNSALTRSKVIERETASTGNVLHDRIIIGRHALNDMSKKRTNKEPMIQYSMVLIISASDEAQLKARVKTAENVFDTIKTPLSPARMDQVYLFQSFLYGNKLDKNTRYWHHITTAKGLAEYLPFTTVKSGSEMGIPIGRIDTNTGKWESLQTAISASRLPVLYNLMLANKEGIKGKKTKNLFTTITGMTGSGKSILAQVLFINGILTGVKSLYIDPKRAIRRQFKKMLQNESWVRRNPRKAKMIASINYVTLDYRQESNVGILDPIVFLPEKDAKTVAFSMLQYLLDNSKSETKIDQETLIRKAIKVVLDWKYKKDKTVGLMNVVDVLIASKIANARRLGEYFKSIVEDSILSLAFSHGNVKGISFDELATVVEIADLSLPDVDSDEVTGDERYSVALMMSLGTFCKQFGERNINEETVELMDEVWVIMRSSEGRKVVKTMKRQGRSQANKLILISQSVNDTQDENDTTGAGERFCFYEDGEEESILKILKLENNEMNLNWIRNMNQGQCIYQDVFGNIQRISVEVLPDWLELFSPEEDTEQSRLEKRYQVR